MTVPATFRRTAKIPNILVLHRANLQRKDVEHRLGRGLIIGRELSDLRRQVQFPKWFDELLAESK